MSKQRQKLDKEHFSVLLLGTDLPLAILSAALARAGLDVLHVDTKDYYGGEWAGLTLSQLVQWATKSSSKGRQRSIADTVDLAFPYFEAQGSNTAQLPEDLVKVDRHYSLAITPTLLASQGPSIDALIRSKVSSYSTFRLLEETAVFVPGQDGASSYLQHVPSSKEDIFKDRSLSLIEKRKLMKFLQAVMEMEKLAQAGDAQAAEADRAEELDMPYDEYLRSKFGLSAKLVDALAYGVSMLPSSPSAIPKIPARVALDRARQHLRSIGRYGNSAYLVGQYGGAGELAQGYCRASAVHGSTFMLDVAVEKVAAAKVGSAGWQVEIDAVDRSVSVDWVIASQQLHDDLIGSEDETEHDEGSERVARAILILDRGLSFQPAASEEESTATSTAEPGQSAKMSRASIVETGLVVFPPGSVAGGSSTQAAQVLMMGEGTFSCPKGQYVYYLSLQLAPAASSAQTSRQILQPYVEQVLRMASTSAPEWSSGKEQEPAGVCVPLVSVFYTQKSTSKPVSSERAAAQDTRRCIPVAFPPEAAAPSAAAADLAPSLADYTDRATSQAEAAFWRILAGSPSSATSDSDRTAEGFRKRALEKDRRRRKRRSPEEFQGRAGAFPQEQEGPEAEGGTIDGYSWDDVVEFFEPPESNPMDEE